MMQLASIWRHPVKSLLGEQLPSATVDADGVRGDRAWGIRDNVTGRILTGRREPGFLLAAASLADDGEPEVSLPGTPRPVRGTGPETDSALTAWLGRDVSLVAAAGAPGGRGEFFADATDDTSQAIEWTMPPGRFVDAMPLLVLTTASLRRAAALYPDGNWDVRRFRPNLLVDVDDEGWVEDAWCNRTLRVGSVELIPREPCIRCTMLTRPQPGLDRDLDIFKTLARHHGGTLGVWTTVDRGGTVEVGDSIELVS